MESAAASNKNLLSSLKKIRGVYKKDFASGQSSGSRTHTGGGSEMPRMFRTDHVIIVDDDEEVPLWRKKTHAGRY